MKISQHNKISASQICWTLFVICLFIIIIQATALAARRTLSYARTRQGGGPIVSGEIIEVKEVIRGSNENTDREQGKGYAFTLRIVEVLRGSLNEEIISIPFSSKGYGRVWEFENKPEPGMKALVFLRDGKGKQWEIFQYPSVVRVLTSFDQASVKTMRKIIKLWELNDIEKELEAVKAGCYDEDVGFQCYCIGILSQRTGGWQGVDLTGHIDQPTASSLIWQVYTKPRTHIRTLHRCDNYFINRFGRLGWETYEPCYRVLSDAVKRHVASGEHAKRYIFDGLVWSLCYYPNHRAENLELISSIIAGNAVGNYKSAAAFRLGSLYDINPANTESRELNDNLMRTLVKLLTHQDPNIARAAAYSTSHIAENLAFFGLVSPEVNAILDYRNTVDLDHYAVSRLKDGENEVAKLMAQKEKRPFHDVNAAVLSGQWEGRLGEQILALGRAGWDSVSGFGAYVSVDKRVLWMDGLDKWPDDIRGDKIWVMGTLTESYDLPVFSVQKNKPFGKGLPVPEGYNLKDATRRFILVGHRWELVKK